jgi:dephospho-CoA kinase
VRDDKYVIGLTGNIAVGKSVVRQMLQHLGAYTVDADQLTHQAMMPGAPAYQPVIEMFGKFVLNDDNTINRATLGSIVFAFPEALAKLEAIVHPVVQQASLTLISRAKQPVIVVEAIKLLESDLSKVVNAIWVVDASPETQMKRLQDKRRMSEEEARRRIVVQRPQADKVARANVIIMNDGNIEETWKQVQVAWNDSRRAMGAAEPEPPKPVTVSNTPAAPAATAQAQLVATAPLAAPVSATQPVPPKPTSIDMSIRRGMPGNADAIAKFVTKMSGRSVERLDVMLAFGQKSYLLAMDKNENVIGVAGWQVENLITRIDEFFIERDVPREGVVRALANAVEEASRELQSEVSMFFLPRSTSADIGQALLGAGYHLLKIEDVKFPAWREAAREMLNSDVIGLMKQLRADRVMKPI